MAKFSAGEVSGGSPVVQRPVCRDAAGRELKPRHPTDGVKSMSVAAETDRAVSIASGTPSYQVIRRNGAVTSFDASKIAVAMTKAFLAVEGNTAAGSRRVHDIVSDLTDQVVTNLARRADAGRTFHIEDVQDQVELALMRGEHHKVARAYVLYREERTRERAKEAEAAAVAAPPRRCA